MIKTVLAIPLIILILSGLGCTSTQEDQTTATPVINNTPAAVESTTTPEPNDTQTDTESTIFPTTGDIPIIADFAADPTSGEGNTTVQFSDLSEGNVTSWAWDINGDDTTDSIEQNPTYTFDKNGEYSVTLTIIGPRGEDTITKGDYISITGCSK